MEDVAAQPVRDAGGHAVTSHVQRVARRGRADGHAAFLQQGTGAPVEAVAEAWLLGRRRALIAHAEQQLYRFAFVESFTAAAAGRAAHTHNEE